MLSLIGQGRSNAEIAEDPCISELTVKSHIGRIFVKLDLPPSDDDNRRVRAVLAYLNELSLGISGFSDITIH